MIKISIFTQFLIDFFLIRGCCCNFLFMTHCDCSYSECSNLCSTPSLVSPWLRVEIDWKMIHAHWLPFSCSNSNFIYLLMYSPLIHQSYCSSTFSFPEKNIARICFRQPILLIVILLIVQYAIVFDQKILKISILPRLIFVDLMFCLCKKRQICRCQWTSRPIPGSPFWASLARFAIWKFEFLNWRSIFYK